VNFVEEEEDKNIVDNILRKTREIFKKIEERHEREREEKIQKEIEKQKIYKKGD
jgi:phosphopantothenate synthetase